MVAMQKKIAKAVEKSGDSITVKKGKSKSSVIDPTLSKAMFRYVREKAQQVKCEEKVKQTRAVIVEKVRGLMEEEGTVTLICKGVKIKITFGAQCAVPEDYLAKVKEILGDRFDDLVNGNAKYTASSNLIKMLCDADDETGLKLRDLLEVKESSPQFTHEAPDPDDLPEA